MTTPRSHRPLYTPAELQRLVAPRSVAIVGASEKEGAFSARTLENLAHYQGAIYLVNPKYTELNGRPCHASLASLPEVPDCVVIALPWHAVLPEVAAAAKAGAGGAIVYASGFAETGLEERIQLQAQISAIAQESGMRVLGPNCLGIANNLMQAGLLFQMGYANLPRQSGRVGLVSQSGALGFALQQGAMHGMSYSHLFTAGNSCDVDMLDLANYLVEDDTCHAIACVFEAAGNAERLMTLAQRAWKRGKPIVVYKTAVGEAAAEAAQSHTGSLAGSSQAFEAALRRGHMISVKSLAELVETADFLAKAPPPQATGVGVMATSGGAAIMCADAAADHGIPLPQPSAETQWVLDTWVPEFGSARNPCDVTGQVLNHPEAFEACARSMLEDRTYGALVLPQVTASQKMAEQRCPTVSQLAQGANKPVCIIWLPDWVEGPGAATYASDDRIGFFRDTERCFKALAAWQHWHGTRQAQPDEASPPALDTGRQQTARAMLAGADSVVTESHAKRLLALYGLPVVSEERVATPEEAGAAAKRLGQPVVLKLDIPGVAHKTELGLVRVGLADDEAVRTAAQHMLDAPAVRTLALDSARFLVQPMVRSTHEIVLGMKRDPVFGPLVMVGLGGVLIEVLGDVACELAPVSAPTAQQMLQRLKAFKLLEGYRGQPGVNLPELAKLIAAFSCLCVELQDEIEEIDINPLLYGPEGFMAVDALFIKSGHPGKEG